MAEPQAQNILGRFTCNFMQCQFHASFSVFNSCLEMDTHWLVGLMFPVNFSGCRPPQLEFLGCPDTDVTHSGCTAGGTRCTSAAAAAAVSSGRIIVSGVVPVYTTFNVA